MRFYTLWAVCCLPPRAAIDCGFNRSMQPEECRRWSKTDSICRSTFYPGRLSCFAFDSPVFSCWQGRHNKWVSAWYKRCCRISFRSVVTPDAPVQRRRTRAVRCNRSVSGSRDLDDLRWTPRSFAGRQDGRRYRPRPIEAHHQVDQVIRCGQPVAFLVRAG